VDRSGSEAAVSFGQCENVSLEMWTRVDRDEGMVVRLGEWEMTGC
jgi:hypothetical protein